MIWYSSGAMTCPAEETLLAFASGTLESDPLEETVAHLDGCLECRKVAALLARGDASAAAPSDPAPQRLGRHILLDVLGSGAMGVVYRAYDPQLDRKVALKLLRQDRQPDGEERRAHLLSEAQAMARVAHPNVIAVHDVGEHGGDIFLAMELVEGPTLRQWLGAQPRSREEILPLFLQAGRGLAAAHAAGLVHRDFKPENVVVGQDGRARVTDFGLALAAGSGVFAGTPAYMSPEQLEGKATDARADQFGFCVSLWEALEGRRPFVGSTLAELRDSRERALSALRSMPAWIRRVLEKGLSRAPDERYESMDALLDVLARDPAVGRRRLALAGAGLGVVGLVVGGLLVLSAFQVRRCQGSSERVDAVWSSPRKQAVERAFRASSEPYAADTLVRITRTIDAWTRDWSAMRIDACLATRERGEQSEELLDLRMACLDRRLDELDGLVGVLATADAATVEHASESAASLGDLKECADLSRLVTSVRAPSAQIRPAVEAVRSRLAEAKANRDAGRYARAGELARIAGQDARALAYRPVEAEALYALGDAQAKAGDYAAGELSLRSAYMTAEAARWDELATHIALRLVQVVGGNLQRFGEAGVWADLVASKLDRLGPRVDFAGMLAYSRAAILQRQGHWTEALARCREALPLLQDAFGAESVRVAQTERLAGSLLLENGELDQARVHHERALTLWIAAVGPEHPDVAMTLSSMGHVLAAAGEIEAAEELHQRGLTIAKASLGDRHPYVANALNNLAMTALARGDLERAQSLGAQAQSIRLAAYGSAHPLVAASLTTLAEIALARGRAQEAFDLGKRALAILEEALPADHPSLAPPLASMGLARLELGPASEAAQLLERALMLRREHPGEPARLATVRFGLARALPDDLARSRDLALEARDAYAKLGAYWKPCVEQIDRWQGGANHRPSTPPLMTGPDSARGAQNPMPPTVPRR
ncbi:MAG: serine/threonine protein kinase [Deltaproteobacteria bacterium]|nr:serine/threonine protein kinase [Deltaproteobacteria bacterium]